MELRFSFKNGHRKRLGQQRSPDHREHTIVRLLACTSKQCDLSNVRIYESGKDSAVHAAGRLKCAATPWWARRRSCLATAVAPLPQAARCGSRDRDIRARRDMRAGVETPLGRSDVHLPTVSVSLVLTRFGSREPAILAVLGSTSAARRRPRCVPRARSRGVVCGGSRALRSRR